MKKDPTFWILLITLFTSILFTIELFFSLPDLVLFSILFNGIPRVWQGFGLAILLYFYVNTKGMQYILIPLLLVILIAWPFIEAVFDWNTGATLKNNIWIVINLALIVNSSLLLLRMKKA